MDEYYDYIVKTFADGYYGYSFVINFKPDSTYDTDHPKKAHAKFTEDFIRYIKRHPTVSYLCIPEISDGGKYHIHGLIFDKECAYGEHTKRFALIANQWRRKYGWNGRQRIYNFTHPYETNDLRFMKKDRSTTFLKVWEYLIKDVGRFRFLPPFGLL